MIRGDADHNYNPAPPPEIQDDNNGMIYVSNAPKKRPVHDKTREVHKKLNYQGHAHRSAHKINGEFKTFAAQPMRDEECVHKCATRFTQPQKEWLYNKYRSLSDHNMQNAYLRGLTHIVGYNLKGKKYIHYLQLPNITIDVCQKYFIGIFGLKSRGSLLCKVLNQNESINDGRGHHQNHPHIDLQIIAVIRRFLGTFPKRSSHYSLKDNMDKDYLDSHLTVAELHRIFTVLYPECAEKVKYSYFIFKFNTEFNLSFGLPRSDLCETCDKLKAQIISNRLTNNPEVTRQLDQELRNHWHEAEVFYKKVKQARENEDESLVALVIDFEKQQPLPKTNVGQEYYKSQLNIQTFCVEDVKTGEATFYVFPENYAKKGSSEVISFVDNYISTLPPTKRNLLLFCDNCGGQNKNCTILAYFQYLVDIGRFDSVFVFYPIPGHSRLPCDRLFGVLQKFIKKNDKILKPSDYIYCIKKAILTKPITVKYANFYFTDDLRSDGNEVVTVKNYKEKLKQVLRPPGGQIQSARAFHFQPNTTPQMTETEQEINWSPVELLKVNVSSEMLISAFRDAMPRTREFIKIAKTKFDNIKYLLNTQYISTSVKFFESLEPVEEDANKDVSLLDAPGQLQVDQCPDRFNQGSNSSVVPNAAERQQPNKRRKKNTCQSIVVPPGQNNSTPAPEVAQPTENHSASQGSNRVLQFINVPFGAPRSHVAFEARPPAQFRFPRPQLLNSLQLQANRPTLPVPHIAGPQFRVPLQPQRKLHPHNRLPLP